MKMRAFCLISLAFATISGFAASRAFFDDFESYAVGSNLHGQGGWTGWANNTNAGALVSSNFAFSPTRSVNITGASDLVHTFSGATNGQWVFSVMQYIPSTSTGTTAVILMNKYRPSYGTNDLNWSVQIRNNMDTGQIISDFGGGATLPMVKDQWVEERCEINLASNSVSEFYNGQLLSTHAWQGGLGGPGLNEIQALDLFANNAAPVYYDNVSLDLFQSYTIPINAGLNLIANQLDHGSNTANEVFANIPNGCVLSKYNNGSGTWSNAYFSAGSWMPGTLTLSPGEGAYLQSPTNFTLTVTGTPHVPVLPVSISPGHLYLLSCQTNDIGTWDNIVGTGPADGTFAYTYNGGFTAYSYSTDDGFWTPIAPSVPVGSALWIRTPGGGGNVYPPPVITQQPQGGTALAGNTAVFTVLATGSGPLAYNWRFNGNFIAGATDSSYQTQPLFLTNAGSFSVVVSNSSGSVTSSPALLAVLAATSNYGLEGFTFTSGPCDNLVPIAGLAPPITWLLPSGPFKITFPAEASVMGVFSDSCPCFDVSPSASQAAGMTFAPESLPVAGSSLQITVRGDAGAVSNVPWAQITVTNLGSSIQVQGTFPSGSPSNLVATLSLGGMVVANVTNLAALQITNSPTQVQVVGVGGSVSLDSPGITVNFAGPIGITSSSNQFDAITFKPIASLGAESITSFRFCGYGIGPLQIICAETQVGPLKIDPSSAVGPVLFHPGNGNVSFATNLLGPWIEVTNAPNPLPLPLNLRQQFIRKVDWSRRCCQFPMLFINSAPLPNATKIRVSADSASTVLYFASASAPNVLDGHYPFYVDFTLPGNAPFPNGNIPGNFYIWVKGNSFTDKHVLVQWLDPNGTVLCQQDVATPCPFSQDPFDTSDQTNMLSACSCVGATITTTSLEEDDTESADVLAQLGPPIQIGPHKFLIPNQSVIDPGGAPVDTVLTVTVEDPLTGDVTTLPSVIPTIDNQGNFIVILPATSGLYALTLELSSTPCNTNTDDGDYDMDTREMTSISTVAGFSFTQQNCHPEIFTFTDTTVADAGYSIVSSSEQWTIYDLDGTPLAIGAGSPFSWTFLTEPIGSQCYKVEMTVTESAPDPNSGPDLTQTLVADSQCVTFTTTLTPGFTQTYLACPTLAGTHVVKFHNTTQNCSDTTYDWDFGDSTAHSSATNPQHTYSLGNYNVTLCATRAPTPTTCKTIAISVGDFVWSAISWSAEACPSGDMVFSSPLPSYWLLPGGNVVGCSGGSCNCACSHDQAVRVCYPSGTTNIVTLWETNSSGGFCSTNFTVYPIDLGCCPKGDFNNTYYYNYNGGTYQITVSEKYNGKFWHSVVCKTKVKKLNSSGHYKRRGAHVHYIRAAYDGMLYAKTAVGDGCDCYLPFGVSGATHHYGWRRATVHHLELYQFLNFRRWDVRLNSLLYTHEVQVDANDPGWTFQHALSDGNCASKHCP
jgi:hypothetical protein